MKRYVYTKRVVALCVSAALLLTGSLAVNAGTTLPEPSDPLFVVTPSPFCPDRGGSLGVSTLTPPDVSQMVQILDEEFEGNELNRDVWRVAVDSQGGGGNRHVSANTNRPENFVVEDGVLKMIARKEFYIQKEGFKGAGASREQRTDEPEKLTLRPYTTSRIDTATKFNIDFCRPGRIDVKYRYHPDVQGQWPAAWILLTDSSGLYGPWPGSGEIDITDHFGGVDLFFGAFNNLFLQNIFFGGRYPFYAIPFSTAPDVGPIGGSAFTASLVWDRDGLMMLYDGTPTLLVTSNVALANAFEPLGALLPIELFRALSGQTVYSHGLGTPPAYLSDQEKADWLAVENIPYTGLFTEDREVGVEKVVKRYQHPAPYDNNGMYFIFDNKIGGGPYGSEVYDAFEAYHAVKDLINDPVHGFDPDFEGVPDEDDLIRALGSGDLVAGAAKLQELKDVVNNAEIFGVQAFPQHEQLEVIEIDSVKYAIPKGLTKVCHKYDAKNPHTIEVDAEAVTAHLAHGDYLGECRDQYVIGPYEEN